MKHCSTQLTTLPNLPEDSVSEVQHHPAPPEKRSLSTMASSSEEAAPHSLLFRHGELVPPPKVTGEEMEGVRLADPKARAKYNAENALLALFRIDLAIMHAWTACPNLYDGGWVSKQLKHIAGHDRIYKPVDLTAYTKSVIERAVRFIQRVRCNQLQYTSRVSQERNGVAEPLVAPFTPIFENPVHDAASLYELVRQGRHPNRRVSLHRTLEMAEQCIYKLLQKPLGVTGRSSPPDMIQRWSYYLWVDGNRMDVATIWENMAKIYKVD